MRQKPLICLKFCKSLSTFSWFNLNNAKYKDLVSGYGFLWDSHGVANKLLIYNGYYIIIIICCVQRILVFLNKFQYHFVFSRLELKTN